MAAHMRRKMRFLNKALGTVRALVGPFSRVRAVMDLQVETLEKRARAEWTLKASLGRVAANVGMIMRVLSKGF